MVVELVAEHRHSAAPRRLSADVPSAGCTANGLPCAVDCCVPARRPSRPAGTLAAGTLAAGTLAGGTVTSETPSGQTVTGAVRPG
jgi:hypothetical protein